MRPTDLPGVEAVLAAGPDDRAFDALLVAGPVVVAVVAVAGRSPATVAVAAAYLVAVVAAVLSNAVGRRSAD